MEKKKNRLTFQFNQNLPSSIKKELPEKERQPEHQVPTSDLEQVSVDWDFQHSEKKGSNQEKDSFEREKEPFELDGLGGTNRYHDSVTQGRTNDSSSGTEPRMYDQVSTKKDRLEASYPLGAKRDRLETSYLPLKKDTYSNPNYLQDNYLKQSYYPQDSYSLDSYSQDSYLKGNFPRDNDLIQDYNYRSTVSKRKKSLNGRVSGLKSGWRLVLISCSAILLGLVLGFSVLHIFSNLDQNQTISETNSQNTDSPAYQGKNESSPPQGKATSGPGDDETAELENPELIPSGTTQEGSIQLPSRTYYVVQAGAFSEWQAAEIMLQQYSNQGYPGQIIGEESPFRLYVGLAATKDDAQRIGSYFEQKDMEIYVREMNIPGVHVTLNLSEDKEQLFLPLLAKGEELLGVITKFSSYAIEEAQLDLGEEEWKRIQELHRAFLQSGKAVLQDWSGEEKKFAEQMNKQLATAVNALETYRQQKHHSFLFQSQQAILEYVKSYEDLVGPNNG